MDKKREVLAYAVDASTGKVTWVKYKDQREKSGAEQAVEDRYLRHALEIMGCDGYEKAAY